MIETHKKILVFLTIIICLFILTGCKSINYGVVADKKFAKNHTVYSPMIMHINKQTRIIPRWINHPDRWSILVQNEHGKEWWEVSEEYYNIVNIGDSVDRREKATDQ